MGYSNLICADQRENNWLLYRETSQVAPRSRYADLMCPHCQKVDECAAIERGFEPDVTIQAVTDVVGTSDGFVCVKATLADVLRKHKVFGIKYLALAGDSRYVVLWPDPLMETERAASRLKFLDPCPACGRPRETLGFVASGSMKLPTQSPAIFGAQIWRETRRGRITQLIADAAAVALLKSVGASGLDWSLDDLRARGRSRPVAVSLKSLDEQVRPGGSSDAQAIQGRWKLMAVERNGQSVVHPSIGQIVEFCGEQFFEPSTNKGRPLGFQIGPQFAPPHLDMAFQNFAPRLGIYALAGDWLVVCSDNPGNPRPERFATHTGDARAKIYQRV